MCRTDVRPRLSPLCLIVAAAAFASLVVPAPANAGGAVIPKSGGVDPDLLDVRVAIAVTPTGTTRWSSITVSDSSPVMWLVPARPGAAVDWAADAWLTALDEATAVRVLPPSAVPACTFPRAPQRAASYATTGTKRQPASVVVHSSADTALGYAAERGYDVSPVVAARIEALYASGWNLVAMETLSTWGAASPGTLRVSDDGGPALPLALTGSQTVKTRVTAFAIGAGVASLPGNRDIAAHNLRWGPNGSSYVSSWREAVLDQGGGATWIRESSTHAALFDGTPVLGGAPARSVAASYFIDVGAEAYVTCTAAARSAGRSEGTVGTACAAGALAKVPGGAACVPTRGDIDPSAFSCGEGADDLALALSGTSPGSAVITRWAGIVSQGSLGENKPISFDPAAAQRLPVIVAGTYHSCGSTSESDPLTPPPEFPGPPTGSGGAGSGAGTGTRYVTETDGCGGSSTSSSTVVYYEEEEEETTTTEDCSGSTTSGGDGWDDGDSDWDDDGWDTDDDSGEGCGADDSSSSSDSCSGGSSSSSSGGSDGWDMPDEASPQGVKTSGRAKIRKKRGSPVSRYALLAALLLLPLRRLRRRTEL